MDEKSNALGATSTVKVITNVENKATFRTTTSNRELISMAECISGDRGKVHYMLCLRDSKSSQPGQRY